MRNKLIGWAIGVVVSVGLIVALNPESLITCGIIGFVCGAVGSIVGGAL